MRCSKKAKKEIKSTTGKVFPGGRAAAVAMIVALCCLGGGAAQASSCYTLAEFEAEQGLRIHSELMVIGLTCLKTPGGQEGYSKYQRFTNRHQHLISQYEGEMISYFTRSGSRQPEKDLHSLRTDLANRISQLAIGNVAGFCRAFTPRLDAALGMDPQKLRRWAQQAWQGTPTARPPCTRR